MKSTGSRIVWDDKWRVRVHQLSLPDGRLVDRAVVEHPGSVGIVPLRPVAQGYEIVMLRQYRLSLDREILEIPAGTRLPGEAWLTCAQRELREETGLAAESFVALGEVWPAPGLTDERMALFLAIGLYPDPLPADEDEAIRLEAHMLTDLVPAALDGKLEDGKSIIAVLRTATYLESGAL